MYGVSGGGRKADGKQGPGEGCVNGGAGSHERPALGGGMVLRSKVKCTTGQLL